MKIANWGNYPSVDADRRRFDHEGDLPTALAGWENCIVRGLGRSYGDASLAPRILEARNARFLAFDEATGELACEAGISLAEIIDVFLPRGWFPAVVPGTKFVTIGGAIAADIHGKNHHVAGSFGRCVQSLRLAGADGDVRECSPKNRSDLFWATCGGMGLTGVILDAVLRLKPVESGYIVQESRRARDLTEIMDLFEAKTDTTYSVAWIDCLARGRRRGRSVLHTGEHAAIDQLSPAQARDPLRPKPRRNWRAPFFLPSFTLNAWSVRAFNACYYALAPRRPNTAVASYDPFFFPLDSVLHWNRIYGRRGFTQYQCALPLAESRRGLVKLLDRIAAAGAGSFLAVLKLFGKSAPGPLSFPMEGYTLALDFPVNPKTLALLEALDEIVLEHGGRLYLAKDARMRPDTFRRGYPRAGELIALKREIDPDGRFRSSLSQRLEIG